MVAIFETGEKIQADGIIPTTSNYRKHPKFPAPGSQDTSWLRPPMNGRKAPSTTRWIHWNSCSVSEHDSPMSYGTCEMKRFLLIQSHTS